LARSGFVSFSVSFPARISSKTKVAPVLTIPDPPTLSIKQQAARREN
jgi:hypothetical protein